MDRNTAIKLPAAENPLLTAVGRYVSECQARGEPGLSEGELLVWLRAQALVPEAHLAPDALYRVHFLMRNALYRWALNCSQWQWQFSALGVRWTQAVRPAEGDQTLPAEDLADSALANYYLNLANLNLSAEAVEALLASFWRQFEGYIQGQGEHLQAALALLELDKLTDFDSLKRQYRRRAMALHPDRGGSDSALQALNSAFELARHHLPASAG